ncbi:MCE family protein [Goodfellowiella coeruleoviolacea]|uniref:Phospholipid/cholesterol/gamma-HCH transport system substrate-binding protein n=1 Tax=Goodfellowiella coeruleoviolacea TaxID=334858 RepID=A0AAE3GAI4_9PSEU|nr:MCE family protein [Goodfellowiella coeruleoviolacea]MCP2163890.1 phospholipid/cholesterol/gamma-HCH transport system substrate-binding protein [Goodfellowiella coeruleoviolacea]
MFVVVALLGISYVSARYAGLDRVWGGGGYVVRVRLADSGGIFSDAEVTYRGVGVGRVGPLRLTEHGVEVDLAIDSSAPAIPDDVEAVVANRSAVGEQYVDLRPRRDGGPFLAEGAVIEQADTRTPLPVETLLADVDALAASVPADALRTVVDELDTAFSGTGPDLAVLLDATRDVTGTASAHLPQTTGLLTDGHTVLATQNDQADALTSFGENAKLLAAQLRTSDPDLRGLIGAAPPAAAQLSELVRENSTNLGVLLANLLTSVTIVDGRLAAVEQTLSSLPEALRVGRSVARPGGLRVGLLNTFFDPLPCTLGYQGTPYRTGQDTTPGEPLNTEARCALSPGSTANVRGARNAPRGPDPTVVAIPPSSGLAGLLGLSTGGP